MLIDRVLYNLAIRTKYVVVENHTYFSNIVENSYLNISI